MSNGTRNIILEPALSPLLRSMPWFTDFFESDRERLSMLPQELKDTARTLLEVWEATARERPHFRDIVANQSALRPQQKSAGPLAALLFGFRFLDVAAMVHDPPHLEDEAVRTVRETEHLPFAINLVSKAPFDTESLKLGDIDRLCGIGGWPALIREIREELLNEVEEDVGLFVGAQNGTSCSTDRRQLISAATRQLQTISHRSGRISVERQLLNMEAAAFFMNWLFQGNYDLPETRKELLEALKQNAEQENVEFSVSTQAIPDVPNLRQPLLMALAISPLILLCGFAIGKTSKASRLNLLRAWFYLGNDRPPLLIRVECELWRRLTDMARGVKSSRQALREFLDAVEPYLDVAGPESHFFSTKTGFHRDPPVGISDAQDIHELPPGPSAAMAKSGSGSTEVTATRNTTMPFNDTSNSSLYTIEALADWIQSQTTHAMNSTGPVLDPSVILGSLLTRASITTGFFGLPNLTESGVIAYHVPQSLGEVRTGDTAHESHPGSGANSQPHPEHQVGKEHEPQEPPVLADPEPSRSREETPHQPAPPSAAGPEVMLPEVGQDKTLPDALPTEGEGRELPMDQDHVAKEPVCPEIDGGELPSHGDATKAGSNDASLGTDPHSMPLVALEPRRSSRLIDQKAITVVTAASLPAGATTSRVKKRKKIVSAETIEDSDSESQSDGEISHKKARLHSPQVEWSDQEEDGVVGPPDRPPRFVSGTPVPRVLGRSYILANPFGQFVSYRPAVYSHSVLSDIETLIRRSIHTQLGAGVISFFEELSDVLGTHRSDLTLLGDPDTHKVCGIYNYDARNYYEVDDGSMELMMKLSEAPIVVGGDARCDLDEAALAAIGHCATMREAHDLARRDDPVLKGPQHVTATFHDFLGEMKRGRQGNILNFLDIPGIRDRYATPSLSTNMVSHRHTMGFPMFARRANFIPVGDINWHLLASENANHPAHVDANGFATEIFVESGAKLVFLGLPPASEPFYMARIDASKTFELDLSGPESEYVAGVLLMPGNRIVLPPCQPHWVLTVRPALCHGGHFYSAATMEKSMWGIIHTFFWDTVITNSDHEVYHELLFRMAAHWCDCITTDTSTYITKCRKTKEVVFDHLPNILTAHGLIQLMSLTSLISLGALLIGQRYSGASCSALLARYREVSGLCDALGKSLDSWIVANGPNDAQAPYTHLSHHHMLQQLVALLRIAKLANHPERTYKDVRDTLESDRKGDARMLSEVAKVHDKKKTVAWGSLKLSFSDCITMRWSLLDSGDWTLTERHTEPKSL
ncbi:hypothetical protein V5O48_008999 [Marasmius crinis-equi]|uniref:JmjC domain-containing protein n=1 Tax=Marasmius crinis-equi TaxID=585013 RepID=A0ABR3FCC3_9AGAR